MTRRRRGRAASGSPPAGDHALQAARMAQVGRWPRPAGLDPAFEPGRRLLSWFLRLARQHQHICLPAEGQEGAAAGAGAGQNEAEAEEEESDDDEEEDESSSEEESSDEDGSVELVSEDDFSMGQLESVMAGESSGSGRRAKRQRT